MMLLLDPLILRIVLVPPSPPLEQAYCWIPCHTMRPKLHKVGNRSLHHSEFICSLSCEPPDPPHIHGLLSFSGDL